MSQTQCPYQGGGQSGGTKQNKPINNIFLKNPFFFTLLHSLMNLWYHNTASAHWEQSYMFTSVTSQGNDHAVTGKWNWFCHQGRPVQVLKIKEAMSRYLCCSPACNTCSSSCKKEKLWASPKFPCRDFGTAVRLQRYLRQVGKGPSKHTWWSTKIAEGSYISGPFSS